MKKILVLFLAFAMIFALSACAGRSADSSASTTQSAAAVSDDLEEAAVAEESSELDNFEPVELSLATSFPTTHGVYAYLEKWAQRVNEVTDGKVTVEIYAGNTLCAAADMHNAVLTGVTDIVETDIAYDVAAFPLASACYLPNMGIKSSVTSTYAYNDFYHLPLDEFDGMEIMFAYGMTPFAILSNKPIETLADMEGLQIRATGFALDAMSALGASPVGMPITETYEAAQKGTVEAICNSFETLKGWNFAEVVKYGTIVPALPTPSHYVAMNQGVWDSLPEAYREAIEAVNTEIVDEMASMFDNLDAEGYEYGLEQNIVFSEIEGAELENWEAALNPTIESWIAEKSAMGLDAQGTYDTLMELVEKYKAIYEN